ncbi:ABC transporter ATP-binding protein [Geothrix rubra]|uniref:ABC transporter ATP-binding protein n=1 Tax=Geothrix rubra TaxID=2927977 RepID=A0ABQ5Q3K7_9BACT|nr:ABC transporter ATP-binding protein [Geothrix rubra]GLH69267.1 ABC transporter ATP-binding protein [Geothrix rubra]
MIEVANVTKTYHAGRPNAYTAVDGVSLAIERGRLTVLKGPSGSGKTTLLSLVGCMARPSSGRIHLRGVKAAGLPAAGGALEITSLPERFLTEIRRATFGFIFQHFNLIKGVSTLENVMLPAYPLGGDPAALRRRAGELLERFGLSRHAREPIDRLSGGELQRVAIARALVNDPAVLIADEPTAHLDSHLSEAFMALMGTFKEGGRTLLIASHDPLVYDSPLVDATHELRDGRLCGKASA